MIERKTKWEDAEIEAVCRELHELSGQELTRIEVDEAGRDSEARRSKESLPDAT